MSQWSADWLAAPVEGSRAPNAIRTVLAYESSNSVFLVKRVTLRRPGATRPSREVYAKFTRL